MKITLASCTLALISLFSADQASAHQVSCPGFSEQGASNPENVAQFYVERASTIVRAALRKDEAALRALVSQTGEFITWRGDYSTGRGDPSTAAVINWAEDLNAVGFESMVFSTGPIGITTSKCQFETIILFRNNDETGGVNVTFSFSEGMLVRAIGQEVTLVHGSVR